MKPFLHVRRAGRIEATLRRLDPKDEYEMVIEDCMLALTHFYIAALHVEGVIPFYADPVHTYKPPQEYFPKPPGPALRQAMEHLLYIERVRNPHVRSDAPYDAAVVEKCLKSYEEGKAAFLKIIGEQAREPEWLAPPAPQEAEAPPG